MKRWPEPTNSFASSGPRERDRHFLLPAKKEPVPGGFETGSIGVSEPMASLLSLVGLGWTGMLVSRTAIAVRRRP